VRVRQLIIRPTSETIIWDMFGKWISSYRDLPLKINQWANVLRWELRTRPFLRSAEFLWQEGHTAHASKEEADAHAREMLDVYADVARDMLAVPVVRGCKSPSERFAGADETYTIEALMQNGWALQSGTSHFLGQNFARAFDVKFQTKDQTAELVWATSWGVSTRLLGALVMTHSDDSGLVLPPSVAPHQVVVVPVGRGKPDNDAKVDAFLERLTADLSAAGLRFHVDTRDMKPGPKFYDWERKGVPLRIEVGPRDVDNGEVILAARTGQEKTTVSFEAGAIGSLVKQQLDRCARSHASLADAWGAREPLACACSCVCARSRATIARLHLGLQPCPPGWCSEPSTVRAHTLSLFLSFTAQVARGRGRADGAWMGAASRRRCWRRPRRGSRA
jgi:prolyl-tRNA synthetase